ncbi:MAG: phosphoribosyltransferase [Magnetospirillum sp.]|nr:phosphoribosyltransferase [Magnetospirillum sp.]
MFRDRTAAGGKLAERLAHLKDADPVVLALPRGGVPVAFEVAKALDAPLDLVLVRKIGAPGYEEYGIGAISDGPDPVVVLDQAAIGFLGIPPQYIEEQKRHQLAEIERRRALWLGGREPIALAGRTAIVVDDGIATGGTMRAALGAVRKRQPRRLVMAVPVAAADSLESLRSEADEVVCLAAPSWFQAVGAFYDEFHQLADEEVADILRHAAHAPAPVPRKVVEGGDARGKPDPS